MQRWEYATTVLYAHIDVEDVKAVLQETRPDWETLPVHHVATLEPQLNKWGQKGWEIVHIEPLNEVGSKGDLGFNFQDYKSWRRYFFCLFKRPL